MNSEVKASVPDHVRSVLAQINIGHLLLILIALHLFALSFPSDTSNGGGRVFDESFYVPAAQDLLHGVPSNLEHPFFGKVWGVLGISLFGNNFFGWRVFYAMIGVVSVWLMYELARQFFSKEKALLAASMLGFENLFFVHTSLFLLEGPPIMFALLGFLAYFKKRYYLGAAGFGLSVLSKETGIFFIGALVLYHVWTNRRTNFLSKRAWKRTLAFVAIVALVVGVPLWGYDSAYLPYANSSVSVQPEVVINPVTHETTTTTLTSTVGSNYVTNPLGNVGFYISYQSALVGCGKIDNWNCFPWMWVLPFGVSPLPYFVNTVSVKTTLANGTVTSQTDYHPIDWQGIGNLVVWYSIWPVAAVIVWKFVRKKAGEVDVLAGSLIAATYLPLYYLSLVTHRVEYAFYFINTDVGIALGIPLAITFLSGESKKLENSLIFLWLAAAVVFFYFYFPVNPFAFR